MLRDEMHKARKKIKETSRKTEEIEQMQKNNNDAFMKKKEDEKKAALELRQ